MFGERLANVRKQKGLSQYELADRLGFSRGQVANYEQGKRQPDYETLQKIADFFDVSLDWLLGRTDKSDLDQQHPDESLFFFDEENITEEEKKALKEHLKFLRWKAAQENKKK